MPCASSRPASPPPRSWSSARHPAPRSRRQLARRACRWRTASSSCTRTTAVQTETNGVLNPTKVTKDGWIVAFTVGLSKLTSDAPTELKPPQGLDAQMGRAAAARAHGAQARPKNKYTVVAQSATFHVLPFLGSVLQEPLSLPPDLHHDDGAAGQEGRGHRAHRAHVGARADLQPHGQQVLLPPEPPGQLHQPAGHTDGPDDRRTRRQQYLCNYTGTRVQYSATEVVNQPYPKTYVGGPTPTKKYAGLGHARSRRAASRSAGFCRQKDESRPAPPEVPVPPPPPSRRRPSRPAVPPSPVVPVGALPPDGVVLAGVVAPLEGEVAPLDGAEDPLVVVPVPLVVEVWRWSRWSSPRPRPPRWAR